MATFTIDGRTYEIPGVETFTMGEAVIFDTYSDVTLDRVAELDGLHTGVFAAQAHIAIKRANPGMSEREIRETVNRQNLLDLLESVVSDEEEEGAGADPPAEPSPSEPASSDDDSAKPAPSGPDSEITGDDRPVTPLRPTGTQG